MHALFDACLPPPDASVLVGSWSVDLLHGRSQTISDRALNQKADSQTATVDIDVDMELQLEPEPDASKGGC